MNLSIPLYQSREGSQITLTTVGLGPHTRSKTGYSPVKVQQALTDELRKHIQEQKPSELPWFQLARGTRLERVKMDLNLRGGGKKRRFSGACPLILEPRWVSEERRLLVAYHPSRQQEWFPVNEDEPLDQQTALFLQKAWANLDDGEVELLWSNSKDLLKIVSFRVQPRTLLDQLPTRKKAIWEDLESDPAKKKGRRDDGGPRLLTKLGVDLTARALEGGLRGGLPRSPGRERMQQLLCGDRKQSTLVIGPAGSGKTTMIHQWILDQIAADDYPSHRNSDKLHRVWGLSGKRIIAGMSHVGDWEQRCMELLEDAQRKRVVLFIDDLHHFGRIGRSRQSDRSLADFFRGPLGRGEIVLVGECTPEQFRALEDDAASFAALFARVHLAPTTQGETFRMMLHETRRIELTETRTINPYALRTILEVGGSLFPNRALPGKALDVLRQLYKEELPDDIKEIGSLEVVRFLGRKTGLPEILLRPEEALDAGELGAQFGRQVIGQPVAVKSACDLIVRIKAGLVDPRRPYGVFLFTGPTGTGKTELAKCIAEFLYGNTGRLIRFDMSELSGYDAPSRLIGDRWQPEGMLTRQVQEQPFSVVLFDEIEKAHPSILNLLLQLFDEGRLTDAGGTTASFVNTVIIMTSNLGAKAGAPLGFGEQGGRVMQDVARAVREFFPPELFNRIDHIVPFSPLPTEVAIEVAQKEMTRLFARRGLADRNIFVYVTRGVAERVAREAFSQQDGARSLKRHIESRIGSQLADHIARGAQAAMQVVRIFDAEDGLRIDIELLSEAASADCDWVLEPLMNQPIIVLQQHLPPVLAFLRELEESNELGQLAEQIRFHLGEHNQGHREHAEQLYNLESIRQELHQFRERIEALQKAPDEAYDQIEVGMFRFGEHIYQSWPRGHVGRTRLFDRRMMLSASGWPARSEILSYLAETAFLRRALRTVHEADQHAVFIELSRASHGSPQGRFARPGEGLLVWLSQAYAVARGQLEEAVIRLENGNVIDLRGADLAERMKEWLAQGPQRVVLKIVGLCVRHFFEHETGSHVWHSVAEQPEIVQVRVTTAPPGRSAGAVLLDHDRARIAYEEGLRRGGEVPPNPDRLLPAVRKIRFDLPRRAGAPSLLDVEDFVLGYSASVWVRSLADALPPLWLLRMSGQPRPPAQG